MPTAPAPSAEVKAQLTPTGALRTGIYMSNFLLISGKRANGDPDADRSVLAKIAIPPSAGRHALARSCCRVG